MKILANDETGICQIMHAFCEEIPDEFNENMKKIDIAYETIIHNK